MCNHKHLTPADYYETPTAVYDAICEHLCFWPSVDLCATVGTTKCCLFVSEEQDFLSYDPTEVPWLWDTLPKLAWCNPPYSGKNKERFLDRVVWLAHERHFTTAVLLPCSPSTKWYAKYVAIASTCTTLIGRIPFLMDGVPDTKPMNSSMVLTFGPMARVHIPTVHMQLDWKRMSNNEDSYQS